MKRILTILATLTATTFITPAVASADVTSTPGGGCVVTGILVIVALNGPVNICPVASPNSTNNSLQVPITVSPHILAPAPQP